MNIDLLSLQPGTPVRLCKLSECGDPLVEASTWDEWNITELNAKSLPVAYDLRGVLISQIEWGKPIRILRLWRNGIQALGLFVSTFVCDVKDGNTIETCNSIYRIDLCPDLDVTLLLAKLEELK